MEGEKKKEELLKRLKIIEDKDDEQLKAMKNMTEKIKEVTDFVKDPLIQEANALINENKSIQNDVDYIKIKITGSGNNVTYDFTVYKTFWGAI